MCFIKRNKYPPNAIYKKGDYVNFRFRDDLYFGYIFEAKENAEGKILYTIQVAGQCPALIKEYKEENIIGLKKK